MVEVGWESREEFFRYHLRGWHRSHSRDYPWRNSREPYEILIAERMLHRTRADQVVPVYQSFLRRYPDIERLAGAEKEDVMALLAPLGLKWRFDSFVHMARAVAGDYGGRVPATMNDLLQLPGVGRYTAEAVLSFAFGLPVAVVDTNTIRVAGRYLAGAEWRGDSRRRRDVRAAVLSLLETSNPVRSNYAVLDLASEVCVSRRPRCIECPVLRECERFQHTVRELGEHRA